MKLYFYLSIFAFLFGFGGIAKSQHRIIYVNGIQNTFSDSQISKDAINELLVKSVTRLGSPRTFVVDGVYNPMGVTGAADLERKTFGTDVQETYVLKSGEEYIASSYRNIELPHNSTRVLNIASAAIVTNILNDMPYGTNELKSSRAMSSLLMVKTKAAVNELVAKIKSSSTSIVVAHSEGNLLANLAWAKIVAELGQDAAKKVRIINVANVSMFSPNNLSITHSTDSVVTLSEGLGVRWWRDTPLCPKDLAHLDGRCPFSVFPRTFVAPSLFGAVGNHNFVSTYLSEVQVSVVSDQGVPLTGVRKTFNEVMEDYIYAAATSLELVNGTQVAQGKVAPSGITASQCYASGSNTLVSCTSPGALALSGTNKQDGMLYRTFAYQEIPKTGGGTFARTECIRDSITGLTWEGKPVDGSFRDAARRVTYYGDSRTNDASAYVAAVNAANLCGYNNWRVPTADEMQSIIDYGKPAGAFAVDSAWFPNTQVRYWISSRLVTNPAWAWVLAPDLGNIGINPQETPQISVRLVRSGS